MPGDIESKIIIENIVFSCPSAKYIIVTDMECNIRNYRLPKGTNQWK